MGGPGYRENWALCVHEGSPARNVGAMFRVLDTLGSVDDDGFDETFRDEQLHRFKDADRYRRPRAPCREYHVDGGSKSRKAGASEYYSVLLRRGLKAMWTVASVRSISRVAGAREGGIYLHVDRIVFAVSSRWMSAREIISACL